MKRTMMMALMMTSVALTGCQSLQPDVPTVTEQDKQSDGPDPSITGELKRQWRRAKGQVREIEECMKNSDRCPTKGQSPDSDELDHRGDPRSWAKGR